MNWIVNVTFFGGGMTTGGAAVYSQGIATVETSIYNMASDVQDARTYFSESKGVNTSQGGSGGFEGAGNKIKTNLGKEIDINPSSKHSTTNKNPGLDGEANSSVDILDSNGNIKTRRWYGPDGKQIRDVDFTDHGNPKVHPEWPHEHGPR